jgi:hypothetical protein
VDETPKERLLREMRAVVRERGYTLAVHGSEMRDLDLIAAPWTYGCSTADELVRALEDELVLVATRRRVPKPHGRLGYVLHGRKWRDDNGHQPIDLSVLATNDERSTMNTSTTTTITGAALGAAVGCVLVYLGELLAKVDIPGPVEGAGVIIATALVALVYPASRS